MIFLGLRSRPYSSYVTWISSLIEIYPSERETMACNVLALGERKLLALEENEKTNLRLRQEGFDVRTFYGTEISQNGGGGPTCLTRPVLRDVE